MSSIASKSECSHFVSRRITGMLLHAFSQLCLTVLGIDDCPIKNVGGKMINRQRHGHFTSRCSAHQHLLLATPPSVTCYLLKERSTRNHHHRNHLLGNDVSLVRRLNFCRRACRNRPLRGNNSSQILTFLHPSEEARGNGRELKSLSF